MYAVSSQVARQIDEICDSFEADFLAGKKPRIEDCVAAAPDLGPPLLYDLLYTELELRRRADLRLDQQEYLQRFPQATQIVRQVFERVKGPDGHSSTGNRRADRTVASQANPPSDTPGSTHETALYSGAEQSSVHSAPQEASAQLGTLGRFVLEAELGKGGFGVVYRARDPELNRLVAIKIPKHGVPESIKHEGQALAKLKKAAGIASIYDISRLEDGRQFIVSEYIDGQSLFKRLKKGPLDMRAAVSLVATVAETLQSAHEQNLYHRDIKPANIVLDAQGQPRLVDFGLALDVDQLGSGPVFAGTAAYISPEQAGKAPWVDGRSDIFSLGAVLYELLLGEPPFAAPSVREVLNRLQNAEARPLRQVKSEIPIELERICLKALQKLPADRYSTANDFAADLRAFLKGLDARPAHPRRRVLIGAVAAVAMIGALAAWKSRTTSPIVASDVDLFLVWQKRGEAWDASPKLSAEHLPLHAQDKIQIHANANTPGYLYIYWFDENGKASRKWPLTDESPTKATKVASPAGPHVGPDAVWWQVDGQPGYDVILAGLSPRPLTPEELARLDQVHVQPVLAGLDRGYLREFEFPASGRQEIRRGASSNPVVSPRGILGEGDAVFESLFSAYHGWVFYHDR